MRSNDKRRDPRSCSRIHRMNRIFKLNTKIPQTRSRLRERQIYVKSEQSFRWHGSRLAELLFKFSNLLHSRKRAHIKQRGRVRRRLKFEHISWLNAKVQRVQAQALKLNTIRAGLVQEFPELAGIWQSTISNCLRNDLGLSYKRLEETVTPTLRPETIRKVFEAAYIQARLREEDQTETIFFDEFKVNTRQHSLKGWTQRGWKGYVKTSKDSFSMTFVWALFQFKIYGLFFSLIIFHTLQTISINLSTLKINYSSIIWLLTNFNKLFL